LQISEFEALVREKDIKLKESELRAATLEAQTKLVVAESQVSLRGVHKYTLLFYKSTDDHNRLPKNNIFSEPGGRSH
jgi:hypothetical protein